MKPSAFLHCLWGDIHAQHRIQIWRLADHKTFLAQAAPAGDYYANGETDVYTGVTLTHPAATKRPGAADARALAGLWLDIDVDGGPEGKTGGVPDLAAAVDMAHAVVDPTVMVGSGYGLHAWYLFDEPWRFATMDDQAAAALASAQWYHLHRQWARGRGWGLDHTHDLARLLRLPGTFNGKGGGRAPVSLLEHRGPRRDREQLLHVAAQAGPDVLQQAAPGAAAVELSAAGPLEGERLEALLENSPELAAIFLHANGYAHWSLSEYDMSIATHLAGAGDWTDQQIAEVLVAHRHHHGETDKAQRIKYLKTTIGKARASVQRRQSTSSQLELLAETGRQAA